MKQETILLVINEQRREKIIKINELNAACSKKKKQKYEKLHSQKHTQKTNRLCIKYVIEQAKNLQKVTRVTVTGSSRPE